MHCRSPATWIASREVLIKYRPKLIMCHVDHLFPYHVTSACVRTDPPSFLLASCLFNLSYQQCLISTQNLCHMDLWSA
jgi:hypothetical protein